MKLGTARPEDSREIARRMKRLRRRSHLTQRVLAEQIGICRQAISEIENRRVKPHESTWDRFTALEARHEEERRISACLKRCFWREPEFLKF